jgi:hypothetical protein
MSNLLNILVVVLIIGWATGYFGYQTGNVIHILLVIALVLVVFRLLDGRKIF